MPHKTDSELIRQAIWNVTYEYVTNEIASDMFRAWLRGNFTGLVHAYNLINWHATTETLRLEFNELDRKQHIEKGAQQ